MRLCILLLVLLICGCSSSKQGKKQPEFENLTRLSPPDSQKYESSKVYVDSVKIINHNQKKALLISGNLANGCTKLQKINHSIQNDSLQISLTAWQPSGKMCTQALFPFSFIYDGLSENELQNASTIGINNKPVKLQR